MENNKTRISGQESLESLSKIPHSYLNILREELEKDKTLVFSKISKTESIVEIHRFQGQIAYLENLFSKIDTILKKS